MLDRECTRCAGILVHACVLAALPVDRLLPGAFPLILATFRDATGAVSIGAVDVARQTILDFQKACRVLGRTSSPDFDSMLDLIEAGPRGLDSAQQVIDTIGSSADAVVPLADVGLLAPVPIPTQIRDCTACDQHMRQAAIT